MKNTLTFLIGIFFSFFLVFSTQAQSVENVRPDNVTDVVDNIFDNHGGHIEEDYTVIHDFLENLVPDNITDPEFSNTCAPPDPQLTSFTTTGVSYNWSDLGIYAYRISYLKLNNLVLSGTEMGQISTLDPEAEFDISNGMVLIAFQSYCSPTVSGELKVIIVDKPVYINEVTDECQCSNTLGNETVEFIGQTNEAEDVVFVPFFHDGAIGIYVGDFEFDTGETATFVVKISTDGSYIYVSYTADCMNNTSMDHSNNLLYVHDESSEGNRLLFGSMSFNGGFYFDPVLGAEGTLSINECGALDGGVDEDGKEEGFIQNSGTIGMNYNLGTANNLEVDLSPNPTVNDISVELPSYIDDASSLDYYITNIYGEKIMLDVIEDNLGNGKLKFSVKGVPNGTYIFVLRTQDKLYGSSFVKME